MRRSSAGLSTDGGAVEHWEGRWSRSPSSRTVVRLAAAGWHVIPDIAGPSLREFLLADVGAWLGS
ncbi:MAG: hypothetical protein ACRDPA_19410, partial [Solirubrobacteraceae bacterium]